MTEKPTAYHPLIVYDKKLIKDAERYRWLKRNNANFAWHPGKYDEKTITGFSAFGTGYLGFSFEDAINKEMKLKRGKNQS